MVLLGLLLSVFAASAPGGHAGDEPDPRGDEDWAARLGQRWRWRVLPGPARPLQVPLERVFALEGGDLLVLWDGGFGRYGSAGWTTASAGWTTLDVQAVTEIADDRLLAVTSHSVLIAGPDTLKTLARVDHPDRLSRLVDGSDGPLIAVDGRVYGVVAGSLSLVAEAPPGVTRTPGLGRTPDGTLFASTDLGLWRKPPGSDWLALALPDDIGDAEPRVFPYVVTDGDRVTFLQRSFGRRHPGLHWDGRALQTLHGDDDNADIVAGALAVGNGRLLVGMRESGLRVVREQHVEVPRQALPFEGALRCVVLAGSRLGLLSHSGQLTVCDLASERWAIHDPGSVGVSGAINALAPARDGGLWIGTHHGIARWDGQGFVEVFTRAGEDGPELEQITGVHEDPEGRLWVVSGSHLDGVLSYDGTRWTTHQDERGPGRSSAHAVIEDADGALWFPLLGPRGQVGRAGQAGQAGQAGRAGLARLSEGRWKRWTTADGLPHDRCYDVAFDAEGTPHVATWAGVARLEGDRWIPLDQVGMGVQRIFCLAFAPDGTLWCGRGPSDPGVLRRHPDGEWEYLHGSGWEGAAAADLSFDPAGRLWFASDFGLGLVDDGRCLTVANGRHEGPLVPSFWPLLADGEDGLWLGSQGGGLVHLHPDDTTPPRITSRPTSTTPSGSSVHVFWDGEDAWEATPREGLRFEVRLDDGRWIDKGHRRDHVFPHVSPGQREIEVRAVDSYGNVSEPASRRVVLDPIELDVTWRPPFLVVFGLLFGVALILYDRTVERRETGRELAALNARLRVINRMLMTSQEDERRNLSRNLHDDLGQLLTAICMDLQQFQRTADGNKQTQAVERALEAARGSLERVREISHLLRPRVLDELGLKVALASALSDFETRSGLEVSSDLDFVRNHVPEPVSVHVYRIVQEALTNVSRHAGATRLDLQLRCESDTIALVIQDDGAGFEPGALPSDRQFGLIGMRERVDQLGGDFELTSRVGEGTRISVSIPLSRAGTSRTPVSESVPSAGHGRS